MRAYILCGGFGTRLRSVIQDSQKAVVDIQGRPFLSLVLDQLRDSGVTEAVLCAFYRADQLAELLPSLETESGLSLKLVVEPQPMGTGGAILNALREVPPEGRYLVLNADTFLDQQAYRLALASEQDTLVAAQVDDRSRYGSLRFGESRQLLALEEKGRAGEGWVNAGVYAFANDSLNEFPVIPCSMEKDILTRLIQSNRLFVTEYMGPFIDIGTPDSLSAFQSAFQRVDQ